MRVLVFGAGAIGSLLGNKLSLAGHDVTLVGRAQYVQVVQSHGLVLEQHGLTHVAHPRATESINELPVGARFWDLIVLTVKGYDTQQATQALAAYVSAGTTVLIIQNGVGGEETVRQALPNAQLVSGVIMWPISILSVGHVECKSTRGGASLAPTQLHQNVTQWAELLSTAGIPTTICVDYRTQKWSKLLLNMLANAVPAILDMPPEAVFADPSLFSIERSAYLETLTVMRTLQIRPMSFPAYPVSLLAWGMRVLPAPLLRPLMRRLVASGRGEKKPSLQLDLANGRKRSEVQYLNGAVATYATRTGLSAPVNQALTETLLSLATGSVPWYEFRRNPPRLMEAIQRARGVLKA